ncbi:MAG: efflux RND transporter periplasmic adaptor subunit [Candidatus Aminicenantales bacterium]
MIFPKKVLGVSFGVIVFGLLIYFLYIKKEGNRLENETAQAPSNSAASALEKAEAVSLPVKAVSIRRGELIVRLKSPGEAFTEKRIVVKAEIESVIKSLNVGEGTHVRTGEVLVELEDLEYRLRLEKQEALRLKYLSELFLEKQFASPEKELSATALEKLDRAKESYEEKRKLFQKGLLSREELERSSKDYELTLIEAGRKKEEIMAASKGLTQAEIDLQIARMELEKTKVKAPFPGIITGINVSVDEHIERGRELFTLVNISRIKVKARVLESEVGKIQVGRGVDLRFSAYPEKVFKGWVVAVSPIINPEDKTCAVHVAVNNPEEAIKPGMHAEVEIAADIYENRLLVPQEAVLVRGGRKLVFVVEGDLAKWRYVETGVENEECVEVLDGVNEGELVITDGHMTLAHDARVRVVE